MKRLFVFFSVLFLFGLLTLVALGFWAGHEITVPGTFEQDQEVAIDPGTSGYAIAQKLQNDHIITQPTIFYAMLRLNPAIIKAGEYAIPARSSMKDVLSILQSGKAIQRNFTMPEGYTVRQIMTILAEDDLFKGTVTREIPEGSLLPETYSFMKNDTRDSMITRMQEAQKKVLAELWEARNPDVPLQSPEQAVVLASIVEKETGKAEERARIAGLFYNRLKSGMPLQSDPTVVYAITDKLGSMEGRRLYRKNLEVESPYNTYQNTGLPPGPICNPGRAALQAVLHPEDNDYLYFVADGTGGHVFAKNLPDHERNVAKWRRFRRENKI